MKRSSPKYLPKIVVVGTGGHAEVVIDIIEKEKKYLIIGLIDASKAPGQTAFDYPIIGDETVLPKLIKTKAISGCFIAIGDNWRRYKVFKKIGLLVKTLPFITAIHPSAQIGRNVRIGCGTVLMAGTVVNSNSRIGDFCILNTKASVDHGNILENFSSLAPNATTGGNVTLRAFSAVSLGANIIHGRTIGSHSVIGASGLVTQDIPDFCVAFGVPARVVKTRREGEKYL